MADFEQHRTALEDLGARIVAISSDTADEARGTIVKQSLGYEVLSGLDAAAAAAEIGCYTGTHDGSGHVQPASFVLDAKGEIVHALYSSGKVGRLTGKDAITLVEDLQTS